MKFRAWCEEHNCGLDVCYEDSDSDTMCALPWDYQYENDERPNNIPQNWRTSSPGHQIPGGFVLLMDSFYCPADIECNCYSKWTLTPQVQSGGKLWLVSGESSPAQNFLEAKVWIGSQQVNAGPPEETDERNSAEGSSEVKS